MSPIRSIAPLSVIGIDVGGANLKYAACDAGSRPTAGEIRTRSRSFPMWQRHHSLADELIEDLSWMIGSQPLEALAVTMTGELADSFLDRAEGVRHIVNHVCSAASKLGIRDVWFYGVDGAFHRPEATAGIVDLLAAANWHALASFVGRTLCSDGLLIDVGSTTTDLIPIAGQEVATAAKSDHDRLAEGSLVYLGGRRTPVAMLVHELTHRGRVVSVMNEVFATMDDVRILLGQVSSVNESASSEIQDVRGLESDLAPAGERCDGERCDGERCDTADGRGRTRPMAANRLARMIGLDHRALTLQEAVLLAQQIHRVARERIAGAIDRVLPSCGDPAAYVISGHAPDLIEVPASVSALHLSQRLGEGVSRVAPAYAVAWLLACSLSRTRSV